MSIQNDELYVDILGTNDTHGAGIEQNKIIDDLKYQVGGYKLLSGVVNILRKDNPKGTLWLDAGDQFQGTLENYKSEGDLMTEFFNTMGLDAATLGNHEWDWGKDRIIKFLNNAKYKYIVSNMKRKSKEEIEKIKQTITDDELKADLDKALEDKVNNFQDKVQQTRVFSLHDGKIKIGVIGLTTKETYLSTAFPPLDYDISDNFTKRIIELSTQLRSKQGVHAVIVVSHVGILCLPINPTQFKTFKIRKSTDNEQDILTCINREINVVLKKLPPYIIDGWVAGHIHETAHSFLGGFPIVQNPLGGKYVNVIRLRFQKIIGGSYKVLTNQAEIQGPIPICSHVFVSSNQCESTPSGNHEMVEYKFRGQVLSKNIDQKVLDLFNSQAFKSIVDDVMKLRNNILFRVDSDFLSIKDDFNPLITLLGQAARRNFCIESKCPDLSKVIGIWGYGGFRSEFFAGEVTEADMNTMFPFKGQVSTFQMNGEQLISTVRVLQSARKPFYCFVGLTMSVTANPFAYVEGTAKLENGNEINPKDIFTIMTFSYSIAKGGRGDFKKLFDTNILDANMPQQVFGEDLKTFADGFENRLYTMDEIAKNPNLKVVKK